MGKRPDPANVANPFKGALEVGSLTSSFASLPLTAEERSHPLALDPLVELVTSKHVAGGEVLEDVLSKVRAEDWGLGGGPQVVRQTAVTGFVHQEQGNPREQGRLPQCRALGTDRLCPLVRRIRWHPRRRRRRPW